MPWTDSLSANRSLNASFGADDFNGWADALTASQLAELIAQFTDSMDFSDSLNGFLTHSVSTTDGLDAWNDTLSALLTHNAAFSDAMETLADALDITVSEAGVLAITFAVTDSMQNWDDSVKGMLTHAVSLVDDWGTLADSVAYGGVGFASGGAIQKLNALQKAGPLSPNRV